MYCPACKIEVDEGEENCPKCGNYLSAYEFEVNSEPEVENIFLQGGANTSPDETIESTSRDDGEGGIDNEIKKIRKRMKKAKYFYKKKKISKKKYVLTMKKCKKKLKELTEKKEASEAEGTAETEDIFVEEVSLPPEVEHRSQLNIEDLYTPIREDEGWIEPLSVTDFESVMKPCPKCDEQVRMHWIVCPSCKGEL